MLWVQPAATAYANFVRNTCCCQQADSLEGGPRAQGDVVGAAISHSICQLCQKHLICQQAASLEGGACTEQLHCQKGVCCQQAALLERGPCAQGDDVGAAISHCHSEGHRLKDSCVH